MRGASGDTQSCSAARPCQRGWEGRLQGADGTWRVLCDCSARTGNGLYCRLGSGLAPFPRLASLRLPDPPRSAPTSLAQSCKSPRPPRSVPPARLAPSPRPALLRPRRAASLGSSPRLAAAPHGPSAGQGARQPLLRVHRPPRPSLRPRHHPHPHPPPSTSSSHPSSCGARRPLTRPRPTAHVPAKAAPDRSRPTRLLLLPRRHRRRSRSPPSGCEVSGSEAAGRMERGGPAPGKAQDGVRRAADGASRRVALLPQGDPARSVLGGAESGRQRG